MAHKQCILCRERLPSHCFSNNQLKKRRGRSKCKYCISTHQGMRMMKKKNASQLQTRHMHRTIANRIAWSSIQKLMKFETVSKGVSFDHSGIGVKNYWDSTLDKSEKLKLKLFCHDYYIGHIISLWWRISMTSLVPDLIAMICKYVNVKHESKIQYRWLNPQLHTLFTDSEYQQLQHDQMTYFEEFIAFLKDTNGRFTSSKYTIHHLCYEMAWEETIPMGYTEYSHDVRLHIFPNGLYQYDGKCDCDEHDPLPNVYLKVPYFGATSTLHSNHCGVWNGNGNCFLLKGFGYEDCDFDAHTCDVINPIRKQMPINCDTLSSVIVHCQRLASQANHL
eukprot:1124144_1